MSILNAAPLASGGWGLSAANDNTLGLIISEVTEAPVASSALRLLAIPATILGIGYIAYEMYQFYNSGLNYDGWTVKYNCRSGSPEFWVSAAGACGASSQWATTGVKPRSFHYLSERPINHDIALMEKAPPDPVYHPNQTYWRETQILTPTSLPVQPLYKASPMPGQPVPWEAPVIRPWEVAEPVPAPEPNPNAKPGTVPSPAPPPGDAPDTEPDAPPKNWPSGSWEASQSFDPSTGQTDNVIRPAAKPKPAERGTKERKVRSRGVSIFKMMDLLSETADVVDAVYDALPDKVKRRWKCGKTRMKGLSIDRAGQYGLGEADCKARAIWHNFDSLDLPKALVNVVKDEIEDRLIGAGHAAQDRLRPRKVYHRLKHTRRF